MSRVKPRRVRPRPQLAELSESGRQAVAEWSRALLEVSSLSALAPIVEQVKGFGGTDRGEALRQLARDLKEDALPLLRQLTEAGDGRLQLEAVVATGQVRSDEAAEILSPLAASGSGEVRKAARRSLEHLRSLGVRAMMPMGGGIIAEAEPQERFQEAIVSSLNGLGQRMVSLAQRIPGHGIAVAQVACDDAHGVYDCAVALVRRHEYDALMRELGADPTRAVAVAPWEYGVHLLREARALNEASRTPPPENFKEIDTMLVQEKTRSYERPLIYEYMEAEALDRPALSAEGASLFEQPMFTFWVLPRDQVKPLADRLQDANTSWLVISEEAQSDRLNNLVRDHADSLFDAPIRARYQRRLEEMAYLLLESEQVHAARVALATALSLAELETAPITIPFVRALIGCSLEALSATGEAGADESRLVLPYGTGEPSVVTAAV